MATVCQHFKFGYCKFRDNCRQEHVKEICENYDCHAYSCRLRHPQTCRYWEKYKRCKFDPCAFAHKNHLSELLEIKKENSEIKEKLASIESALEVSRNSEKSDDIEKLEKKLGEVEHQIEKKNDQIKKLESEIDNLHLKIAEQKHIVDKVNKKLNFLKENEDLFFAFQDKFDKLEKKVNLIENVESDKTTISQEDQIENKCEQCDFVAKNEQGLKVHFKAKHTEKKKFKCWVCDFSSETKSELTDHNDVYWDSHRMTFYPEKKKYYLKEMEQLKNDGFTVKESFYNEVMKCDD